jgi:hypothetical protein
VLLRCLARRYIEYAALTDLALLEQTTLGQQEDYKMEQAANVDGLKL